MSGDYFIDTNIFVYCFDTTEPEKLRIANNLIERGLSEAEGVISFQVIQEFLNVALQKFTVPLTTEDAVVYLESILLPLCSVSPEIELYRDACNVKSRTGFSFYDSLILAAALKAGCPTLYSEDFQHGFTLDNLTIVNPFIG